MYDNHASNTEYVRQFKMMDTEIVQHIKMTKKMYTEIFFAKKI